MDIASTRSPATPQPIARPDGPRVPGRPLARPAAGDEPPATGAPSLWHVLTPEERAFFSQLEGLGTLTYRPGGAPAAPDAPTGQRIDVRG